MARTKLRKAMGLWLALPGQAERWVTKQLLAEHLLVTTRWIESQQQVGLPYLRLGSINRYSITDVEGWLRERYGRGG